MVSTSLIGFIIAALIVLLIPGPGVIYVVARSLSLGQKAGLVSVLGLSTGALLQVVVACLGLSAILLTSATAFNTIKYLGAAYLIYLGIQAFREPRSSVCFDAPARGYSLHRLFIDGVVISLFNPKIALFFLAFLPQFVNPASGSVFSQVLLLGILYVLLAFCTDSTYALLAARLRRFLGSRLINGPMPQYGSGVLYLGLGVGAAMTEQNPKQVMLR